MATKPNETASTFTVCTAAPRSRFRFLVNVAYIAGCGRSGTTLLARLLGEIPGFAAVGEAGTYFLGPRNRGATGIPCGCGARMDECSFWQGITVDADLRDLARPFMRARYTHRALWWRPDVHPDLQRFLAGASEFYHALAVRTGAAVIVDSSNSPVFAALAARAPGIRLHVLHMIRDLRGVVSSWQHPKAYIAAMPPRRCILRWYRANLGAELLKGRTAAFSRLRYEDFILHPRAVLEQTASRIKGSPVRCPFVGNGHAQVHVQHLAGGNPDKFRCGDIFLNQRKAELDQNLNRIISLAAAPLLLRYGYFSLKYGRNALQSGQPIRQT